MGFSFFPSGQDPDAHDFLRLNSQTYFITFLYIFFHYAHLGGRTAQAYSYPYSLLLRMLFAALMGHNTAIVAFPMRVPYKPALSPLHQLWVCSRRLSEFPDPTTEPQGPGGGGGGVSQGISLELADDNQHLPSMRGELCSKFPYCSFLLEYRLRRF